MPVERWPRAARERMANPPAGTALAPPFRPAVRKGALNERGGSRVTELGTNVKRFAIMVTNHFQPLTYRRDLHSTATEPRLGR